MIFTITYSILFIVTVITLQMVIPYFKMVYYRLKYGKGVSFYYYPFFGRVKQYRYATKKYNDMLYYRKRQRTDHPEVDIELTNHYSGKLVFHIERPEHIKFIVTNQNLYVKPDLEFGDLYIQKGVIFNNQEWQEQRHFLGKFFTFQVVDQSFETVRLETQKAFKNKEGQFNVHQICSRIAGEVVTKTVFGDNLESVTFDGIPFSSHMAMTVAKLLGYAKSSQTYCMLRKVFTKNPPKFLQTKLEIQTLEQLEKIKLVIKETIKTKSKNLGNDFLSEYIRETQKNPKITEETIIHQYITLLFAGMDTTSTLAFTICILLAQNPSTQSRLREEILNKNKSYDELTAKSVNNEYPLLEATIKESLRMCSPAIGLIARVAKDGHYIGKYYIPKGSLIFAGYLQNCYDPQYFEDPFTFNIDRWLNGKNSDKEVSIFTPFSSGNRNCLGQHLSKQEVRLMLIYILMNYELELVNKDLVWQLEFTYTVKDKNSILFKRIQK